MPVFNADNTCSIYIASISMPFTGIPPVVPVAQCYSMVGPVSAWIGDHLRAGKLSRYVTSHPGQPSLAVPRG